MDPLWSLFHLCREEEFCLLERQDAAKGAVWEGQAGPDRDRRALSGDGGAPLWSCPVGAEPPPGFLSYAVPAHLVGL